MGAIHPSIRIEGGLLGPDVFDELRAGDLPGQRPVDFAAAAAPPASPAAGDRVREARPVYGGTVRPPRRLGDEIAEAFSDARRLWTVFGHRRARIGAGDPGTSVTRDAWMIPFLGLLDYELAYNRRAYDAGGLTFAISHRAGSAATAPPVHVVGVGQDLGRAPATGRPRLAPHALMQEYLNRTEALWGLVTNGRTLRLLRGVQSVRRQAYVEFDLPGMLEEQRFEDFEALYRLLHRTRLPEDDGGASDCLLERYYAHGVEQGGRIRERLRVGVEHCLVRLAAGFLERPENEGLRRRVAAEGAGQPAKPSIHAAPRVEHVAPASLHEPGRPGRAAARVEPAADAADADPLTAAEFYRALLTLVYRLLFLLVAEDRGLLGAGRLYASDYGVGRLRRRLDRPGSETGRDHDDLWRSLRVLWRVLSSDTPEQALGNRPLASLLDLPVLNGDLFKPGPFDDATIGNRALLAALDPVFRYREGPSSPPRRINYAALDVEELGSVYESLLDFAPLVERDAEGRLTFRLAPGSERKSTGSFYTPPTLVDALVKSALDPVLEARLEGCATPAERERAVLSLRVCDPACGSGHFLLAAARRLGLALARLRTGESAPGPERLREAVRDVVSNSIYGVDRNPLAVDLCRVALWIESHSAGRPLTFLDHRIRCGDSLAGVLDADVLSAGIPDGAFAPLTGDDRASARRLKARNRREREDGQRRLPWDGGEALADFADFGARVGAIADDSPEAVRRKRALFEGRYADPARRRLRQACDLWTAAFFQALRPGGPEVTTAALADHLAGAAVDPRALARAESLAAAHRFFHWRLEFPEVFDDRGAAGPGFDVVLGNPPWERIKLQEKEFFAGREPRIADARNAAERKRLIRALETENPALHGAFRAALHGSESRSRFLRASGRYPLCGRGDINLYAVFAETVRRLLNGRGRAGCVLPTGIATDDTTKHFFRDVVATRSLVSLLDFENKGLFPDVHSSYKFCLFTAAGGARPAAERARFFFFAHDAKELSDEERAFTLSPDEIALLNPNTRTCPIFRSGKDAQLTKAIYRRVPVLARNLEREREREREREKDAIKARIRGASASPRCSTCRTIRICSEPARSSKRTAGGWAVPRVVRTRTVGRPVPPDDRHVERLRSVPHAGTARGGRLAARRQRLPQRGGRPPARTPAALRSEDGPPVRPPLGDVRRRQDARPDAGRKAGPAPRRPAPLLGRCAGGVPAHRRPAEGAAGRAARGQRRIRSGLCFHRGRVCAAPARRGRCPGRRRRIPEALLPALADGLAAHGPQYG